MSAHELVFCNPPLDHNRPSGGTVVVNAAPVELLATLSLELARDPAQPDARVVLRGIDTSEASREHVVELQAPATAVRVIVVVRVPAMADAAPRRLILEVATPGTTCHARVLSVSPCNL
jgi:hypothetical protein